MTPPAKARADRVRGAPAWHGDRDSSNKNLIKIEIIYREKPIKSSVIFSILSCLLRYYFAIDEKASQCQ